MNLQRDSVCQRDSRTDRRPQISAVMTVWLGLLVTTLLAVCSVSGQSDPSGLQAVIPPSLLDCYRNSSLLTREYLPPLTLGVLLALVRKLETVPGVFLDMRTLSSQIMTTYRMDGIEKNPDVAATQYVTPYGPSGNQFYRYKLLMDGLIPSSGSTFPSSALRDQEKCALHLMLSSSVDHSERGDEGSTCNSLTNYVRWDSRVPRRSARSVQSYNEEVELMDPHHQQYGTQARWMESGYSSTGLTCPLENGVVYTRYGAVSLGQVVGGVAAGLQSQSVSRRSLMLVAKANSLRGRSFKFPRLYSPTDNNPNISNVWAASLSGEIAEVALLQGPLANSQMRVGLTGGWNDSVLPRYYFLNDDTPNAMTDTDIRGSIDGLIIGTNAQSWSSQVGGGGGLKLSQLLDMYYSERGVLNTNIRACQRVAQFNTMFTPDQIASQSYAFSGVLELDLPTSVNVDDAGLQNFNYLAVQKFISYIPQMQDQQCSFGSTSYTNIPSTNTGQVTNIVTPAVHLYLVMDYSFDFLDASRIASQLAERLEVSRFTGNISVINAKDASATVNSTNNLLDLYANFTRYNYTNSQRGFDLARVVRDVGRALRYRLDYDRQLGTAGGPASVVLIVPTASSTVSDNDKTYILSRLSDLQKYVPDARFMFLTPGSRDKFSAFVQDPSKDIFTLTLSDIPTSVDSVISRLKTVPRRIINPSCMSFYGTSSSPSSGLVLRTYVEPVGGVQYFRIHPNYFYSTGSGSIQISSSSGRTLNVCQSRTNPTPGNSSSSSSSSDSCKQITSDTFTISLNSLCGDSSISSCQPVYFSIAVVASSSAAFVSCTDDRCRYPDNIAVDIRQDGLTCSSNGRLTTHSTLFLLLLVASSQIWRQLWGT